MKKKSAILSKQKKNNIIARKRLDKITRPAIEKENKIKHDKAIIAAEKYAKRLIENKTPSEERLITEFTARGVDFKFQSIIIQEDTFYIPDFLIDKLIIEVDGGYHNTREQNIKDRARTHYLNQWGYDVIRFTNDQVFDNSYKVVTEILAYINPDEEIKECQHQFKFVEEDLIECETCLQQYPIDGGSENKFL